MAARPAENMGQREVLRFSNRVVDGWMVLRHDRYPLHRPNVEHPQGVWKRPQAKQAQAVQPQIEVSVAVLEAGQGRLGKMLDVAGDSGRLLGQPLEYGRHDP